MDLVIRAVVASALVCLLTQVIGRRELSWLEPFDLIVLVMIDDSSTGRNADDFSVTGRFSSAARSG